MKNKLKRVTIATLSACMIANAVPIPGNVANEYYGAAEPPVRCGESHLSGLTEPPHFIY